MIRNNSKPNFFRQRPFVSVGIVLAAVVTSIGAVRLATLSKSTHNPGSNSAAFTVQRGPLRISVLESGTIKPKEQVILKSEIEGVASVLWIIPEGTAVKKGDLLVELDASQLVDSKIDQEIKVQNGEAAWIGARENLEVVKNQAQSDIDKAELTLEFAGQDLKKYLEGEYPKEVNELTNQIQYAQEELERAKDKWDWSERLFKEKYISETERNADRLAWRKTQLNLELAKSNIHLLENFTHDRMLAQLKSDVNQAGMALERTRRKANADTVQAEADLKAKDSEFGRQKDKLRKIETQIERAKMYAPADGLVIYATSAKMGGGRMDSRQPLDVGQSVKEREELIYLPTTSSVKAEVDVHEASLKKVQVGLDTIITVDALPGKTFFGTVASIAPLPDAQSMWMNPDLKVYNTDIYLSNNDGHLRTGMSCKAEIIVEEYDSAIYVPMQAVLRVAGEPTCYVVKNNVLEPRKVEIGLDNNRMVRIIKGLEEGEVVSLTPPLSAGGVEPLIARNNGSNQKAGEASVGEGQPPNGQAPQTVGEEPASQDRSEGRDPVKNMSPEDREKMRERFKNMSPEEREKLRGQRTGRKSRKSDEQ